MNDCYDENYIERQVPYVEHSAALDTPRTKHLKIKLNKKKSNNRDSPVSKKSMDLLLNDQNSINENYSNSSQDDPNIIDELQETNIDNTEDETSNTIQKSSHVKSAFTKYSKLFKDNNNNDNKRNSNKNSLSSNDQTKTLNIVDEKHKEDEIEKAFLKSIEKSVENVSNPIKTPNNSINSRKTYPNLKPAQVPSSPVQLSKKTVNEVSFENSLIDTSLVDNADTNDLFSKSFSNQMSDSEIKDPPKEKSRKNSMNKESSFETFMKLGRNKAKSTSDTTNLNGKNRNKKNSSKSIHFNLIDELVQQK